MTNFDYEKLKPIIKQNLTLAEAITFESLSEQSGFEITDISEYFDHIEQSFLLNITSDIKKQSFSNLYNSLFYFLSIGANPGYRKLAKHSGESKSFVKKYVSNLKSALGIPLVESPFISNTTVTLEEKNMLLDDDFDFTYDDDTFVRRFNLFLSTAQCKTMLSLSQFMNLNIFEIRRKMQELNLKADFNLETSTCDLNPSFDEVISEGKPQINYSFPKKSKNTCSCGNFLNLLTLFFSFATFIVAINILHKI